MPNFLTASGAFAFAIIASMIFVFPLFAVLIAIGYFFIKDFNDNPEKYGKAKDEDNETKFR